MKRLIVEVGMSRNHDACRKRQIRTQTLGPPYGISRDLPICLIRIEDQTDTPDVRDLKAEVSEHLERISLS